MEWIAAGEKMPEMGQIVWLYSALMSPTLATIVKCPHAEDEEPYWNFINPLNGYETWCKIMPSDLWREKNGMD